MFLKEFEVRWSDLDANRHLSNVSYLTYAGETRMAFLQEMMNIFSSKFVI